MRPWSGIFLFVFLVVLSLGCSGKLSPVTPDRPFRLSAEFLNANKWTLWSSGWLSMQYKNVDLSVDVTAGETEPDVGLPAKVNGSHWTLATTIEKDYGYSPPIAIIKYAWLDDQDPDGPAASSGAAYTASVMIGEEIACARVSVIRPIINSYSIAARAGVAFMSRQTNPALTDWDIKAFTMEWASDNQFPDYSPDISDIETISEPNNGTDDYSPDLAWDPYACLLHVAWTGYVEEVEDHHYRVCYNTWDGENDPGDVTPIYDPNDYDYAGWAPRIAVGSAGIGGCMDIVGIV